MSEDNDFRGLSRIVDLSLKAADKESSLLKDKLDNLQQKYDFMKMCAGSGNDLERAYNKILTENPGITPRDAYARYRTELAIEKINSYSTRAKNMLNTCVEGFKDFANKHCTIDNAIVAGACIIAGLSILGTASYLTGYHKPVIEFISNCF